MTTWRLDESARGVFSIVATPFDDAGALDVDSIPGLVDFYLRCHVDGLTVLGMMGEAPKLSGAESLEFLRASMGAVGGRVPVVVGVSNPGTRSLAEFSHAAMAEGAAAVMIAPIPTVRTDDQIHGYFSTVMRALGPEVPVVLQDYPPATTVQMSAALIGRLIDDFPQIVMLKHEDCPGLNKLTAIRRQSAERGRRRVSILIGNGGLHLPQELARGADGAMTGFAFPEILVEVCRSFAAGDFARGEDVFDAYLPLVRHEAQPGVGLALRKEVLRRRGAISAHVREPGPRLTPEDHKELDWLIGRVERRVAALARMEITA